MSDCTSEVGGGSDGAKELEHLNALTADVVAESKVRRERQMEGREKKREGVERMNFGGGNREERLRV